MAPLLHNTTGFLHLRASTVCSIFGTVVEFLWYIRIVFAETTKHMNTRQFSMWRILQM